jgi:hypothetical protein
MPLVRFDISKTSSRGRVAMSMTVRNAMIEAANVQANSRVQINYEPRPDEITYREQGYLGIDRTPELIVIQLTWVGRRSTEVSKKLYQPSPTKSTPNRACAGKTSASPILAVRTGRSTMPRCSTSLDGGQLPTGRTRRFLPATVGSKYKHGMA